MLASLLTIAALHWLILLTPGPNVLLVSALAAAGHRRSALMAAGGITLVAGTWATLALAGVHAVFASHAVLRFAVQGAGALYLSSIAVRLWRAKGMDPVSPSGAPSALAALRLGFLTNIANPKSALFFGSVFATALPPQPGLPLAAWAIAVVLLNAFAWHVLLAVLFSRPRVQALYAAHARAFCRLAGTAVGFFGLRLLADAWRGVRSA
jgi:threonine/homoserine/homoserine lactone efflux protein